MGQIGEEVGMEEGEGKMGKEKGYGERGEEGEGLYLYPRSLGLFHEVVFLQGYSIFPL